MANDAQVSAPAAVAARTPLKIVWGAVATLLSVVYTAILATAAAVCAMLGYPAPVTQIARLWGWLIIRTCGIRVEIEGLENLAGLRSYLVVSNHQSFFDIFAVAAFMPGAIRFVAKKELLKIPVLGYALNNSCHIVIDRQAGGKEIRRAIEVTRMGYSICIFAEGHRFNDNRVHEFEDGAAWLAILAKQPVVPMAISGSGRFFPRRAKIVVPGGTMRMRIGQPIATAG
ncbi:MAG TPA: lysophospholipid acyltransferase family protein, partial [Candidatus Binataceae bacterium]|nr:lysophospholipid acyltransferase family protein [Candidatus Binataceae bacterium]